MAVNHAIYIWTGPDNQKHLLLPERSPAVLNTTFLGWEVAVPRGALPPVPAGLGVAWKCIPHWKAFVHFGRSIYPDPTVVQVNQKDVFTLVFSAAMWTDVMQAITRDGQLFAAPIPDAVALDGLVDLAV